MTRKALIETATGVLLEHGFVDYQPGAGQAAIEVPDDFNAAPRATRHNGGKWEPYTPPPPTEAEQTAMLNAEFEAQKTLRAIVLWLAQKLAVPPAQARSEILALRKTL